MTEHSATHTPAQGLAAAARGLLSRDLVNVVEFSRPRRSVTEGPAAAEAAPSRLPAWPPRGPWSTVGASVPERRKPSLRAARSLVDLKPAEEQEDPGAGARRHEEDQRIDPGRRRAGRSSLARGGGRELGGAESPSPKLAREGGLLGVHDGALRLAPRGRRGELLGPHLAGGLADVRVHLAERRIGDLAV